MKGNKKQPVNFQRRNTRPQLLINFDDKEKIEQGRKEQSGRYFDKRKIWVLQIKIRGK